MSQQNFAFFKYGVLIEHGTSQDLDMRLCGNIPFKNDTTQSCMGVVQCYLNQSNALFSSKARKLFLFYLDIAEILLQHPFFPLTAAE
jgi:hypothetical protein